MTVKAFMCTHPRFSQLVICLLIGLLSATPALAEIYTWTDADGNTVFSDQPSEGAKKIELPPPQTFKPDIRPMVVTPDAGKKKEVKPRYHILDITQPLHDQAMWANNGQIDVVLAVEPALATVEGHGISISLDGKVVMKNTIDTHISLSAIDRGSHTLIAEIHDRNGKVLISSKPVTFHIHRRSSLN